MGRQCNTPSEVESLTTEVENALDQLKSLAGDEKKGKLDDILKMISYYGDLTEKMESRRTNVYNLGLQVLAISVAALAFLGGQVPVSEMPPQYLPILTAVAGVAFVFASASVVIGLLYHYQSGFRYPFLQFKQYSNRWKWFYYGNPEITKINTRPVLPSRDDSSTTFPYLKGLKLLASNYCKETVDEELRDGVIQLYLLQVHNYYKNRFYLQLIRVWKVAFWTVAFWAVICIPVCLYAIWCF